MTLKYWWKYEGSKILGIILGKKSPKFIRNIYWSWWWNSKYHCTYPGVCTKSDDVFSPDHFLYDELWFNWENFLGFQIKRLIKIANKHLD